MSPAPLERHQLISRFLVDGEPVTVQWVSQPIDDSDPLVVAPSARRTADEQPA